MIGAPLAVPKPPPNTARIRFVTTKGNWLSEFILFGTANGDPEGVSHAENVLDDGTIVAALAPTVARVPGDYDPSYTMQVFVDCLMTPEMYAAWKDFLLSKIGEPYDLWAIGGFITHFNLHRRDATICSELTVEALRACGWYSRPLVLNAYQISPVAALLMHDCDPRALVHAPEYLAR